MATANSKLNLPSLECLQYYHRRPPPCRTFLRRIIVVRSPLSVKGIRGLALKPCRAFRSEKGGEEGEFEKKRKKNKYWWESQKGVDNVVKLFRSAVWSCSKPSLRSDYKFREVLEKLEDNLFLLALYVGRFIITMMSTGAILLIGFQLSGGDEQMNNVIWYSWLGGIIIGTMLGSNMVLEEASRAGPRNVVITGRYCSRLPPYQNRALTSGHNF